MAAASAPSTVRRQGALLLAGAGLGTALLLARPPVDGAYPACPWRAITGWDCPFCGGLRAVAALAHGDWATAVDFNLLVAIAVPAAVLVALVAVVLGPRGAPLVGALTSRPAFIVAAFAVGGFFVLRMLPFASWLTTAG